MIQNDYYWIIYVVSASGWVESTQQNQNVMLRLDEPPSVDVDSQYHVLQLMLMEELQFCAFFAASGLPHSFIIMHQNRYQQCIGAFILQAASESVKVESLQPWISHTFLLKAGGAPNIFYIFNTDVQHYVCGIVFNVASTQDVTGNIPRKPPK